MSLKGVPNPLRGLTSVRKFTATKRDVQPVVRSMQQGQMTNPGWSAAKPGAITLQKQSHSFEVLKAKVAAVAFFDEYDSLVKEAAGISSLIRKLISPVARVKVKVRKLPKIKAPTKSMTRLGPPAAPKLLAAPRTRVALPSKSIRQKMYGRARALKGSSLARKIGIQRARITRAGKRSRVAKVRVGKIRVPKVKPPKVKTSAIKRPTATEMEDKLRQRLGQKTVLGRPKGEMSQALKNALVIGAGTGAGFGVGYVPRILARMGAIKLKQKGMARKLPWVTTPLGLLGGGVAAYISSRQMKEAGKRIKESVEKAKARG